MSTTVNESELKDLMSLAQTVNAANGMRLPLLLHGTHGIGKTEMVKRFGEQLGYNVVCLYLSTQDVSDLIGLPQKVQNEDGSWKTVFAKPDWLHEGTTADKPTLFYLDEINRAPQYVLQTMLPFVLDGTLHTHSIRKNDIVLGAMNPDSAEYNVESISDEALLSRFAHLYFEPSVSEYASYCLKTKCHPSIMSLIEKAPKGIDRIGVDPGDRIIATPDRRSVWKIGQIMNIVPREQFKKIGYHLVASMIGSDLAGPLMQEYNTETALSVEDIINGNAMDAAKTGKIDFERDVDKIAILNESLVAKLGSDKEGIWAYTKTGLVSMKLKKPQVENLKAWINGLQLDSQYGLVRNLKYKFTENFGEAEGTKTMVALLKKVDDTLIRRVIASGALSEKK